VVLIIIAVIGAYRGTLYAWGWFHEEPAPSDEAVNAALTIPEEELDLGRVWETNSHEHVVHITNLTDRPVTITNFEKTCNCVTITPYADVTLEPRETKAFALRLGLNSRTKPSDPMATEPFRVRFAARYEGQPEHAKAEWQLKAEVRPTIRLNPSVFRLGTRSDRQPIEEHIQIEAGPGVESIEGEPAAGWGLEISRVGAGEASRKFAGVLRRKGDARPGTVSDVIRFHPLDDQGRRLPPKELKVEGEVARDVVADPRELHHGRKPCGTSAEESIRLVSLTNRTFRVIAADSTSADLKVARVAGPGGGWLYSLQIRFTAPGEQEALAQFTIQDDEGKEFKVAVPVRYHGAAGPG
jgi:hypothetical protein